MGKTDPLLGRRFGEEKMKTLSFIFIGHKFYDESKTHMSSIYQIIKDGEYKRYDYGFLQKDAAENLIIIRPATKEELAFFEAKLQEWKELFNEREKET
jgi:hypothetical protein